MFDKLLQASLQVFTNPTNSAIVMKTAKACAQIHGLDFKTGTSIYIKGNFKELKNDQKVIFIFLIQAIKKFNVT